MLWLLTGPFNYGKSRYLSSLVAILRERLHITIGGMINHGLIEKGRKVGYVCESLVDGSRHVFAQLKSRVEENPDDISCGSWIISAEGISSARHVLAAALQAKPDLVIIDEFGILEAQGRGLRYEIDSLVSSDIPLIIVVRESLVDAIRDIYIDYQPEIIDVRHNNLDVDCLKDLLFYKWFSSHIH